MVFQIGGRDFDSILDVSSHLHPMVDIKKKIKIKKLVKLIKYSMGGKHNKVHCFLVLVLDTPLVSQKDKRVFFKNLN